MKSNNCTGMARGAGWHQWLSIDFSLYLKATASLLPTAILRMRSRMMNATGSRKVVVGKLACNIAMAIQLFLVVLSNFATGRFTFFNDLARKPIVFARWLRHDTSCSVCHNVNTYSLHDDSDTTRNVSFVTIQTIANVVFVREMTHEVVFRAKQHT